MNFTLLAFLVVLTMSKIKTSQALPCKEASLSCPVMTRKNRRLKGFTFNTFHSASLVSCGLLCQRNPRCVSTNFRKVFDSTGICELNKKGAFFPEKGTELEHDEYAVYAQFYKTKHHCQAFKKEFKVVSCKCMESPVPLGMESGVITDSQITASSEYPSNHGARNARLHFKGARHPGFVSAGWAAKEKNTNQWLQVDLRQTTEVIGIATQGRHDSDQWVTTYKLQYGQDGQTFRVYRRNGDTSDTVFTGNTDRDTVVYHDFNPVIVARFVRALPMGWHGYIAMRMELYSCQAE